jgi:hypothetical protein
MPPSMPPSPPPGSAGAAPYGQMPPSPKKSSTAPIVVILIVVCFGGIFVLGIIAAIAIPAFMRARMSANEASALAAMRTMASAQVAWLSTHDGQPAKPMCLAEPVRCGDPQSSPFLDPEMASLQERSGYQFGFLLRPGEDAAASGADADAATPAGEAGATADGPTDAEVRAELEKFSTPDTGATPGQPPSPAPVAVPRRGRAAPPVDRGGFVYWASPANPGTTGNRRFCVDETGMVRAYSLDDTWTPPSDAEPRCPAAGRGIE